jgi:hypothetical protein
MPEFCDLNVVMPRATKTTRTSSLPPSLQPDLVALSCSGYSTVAISRTVYGRPKKTSDLCDFDPSGWAQVVAAMSADSAMLRLRDGRLPLTMLKRLTIVAETPEDASSSLSQEVVNSYDIIAVSFSAC